MKEIQKRKSHIADYVVSIIVNLVLLALFNKVSSLSLSWLKDSAFVVITLFELSFIVQIIGDIILLINDQQLVKQIIKIILNAVSLLPLYALYILYPFDFSKVFAPVWLDLMVHIFIILSMIGVAIAIIVDITKLLRQEKKYV